MNFLLGENQAIAGGGRSRSLREESPGTAEQGGG